MVMHVGIRCALGSSRYGPRPSEYFTEYIVKLTKKDLGLGRPESRERARGAGARWSVECGERVACGDWCVEAGARVGCGRLFGGRNYVLVHRTCPQQRDQSPECQSYCILTCRVELERARRREGGAGGRRSRRPEPGRERPGSRLRGGAWSAADPSPTTHDVSLLFA